MRRLDHLNNACLAKLSWKVLTEEDNWWVRLVKSKYLRNEDFLDNKIRQNYFFAWKSIMKSRDVILRGMSWRVGNDQDILFWNHNWVFPYPLFHLVPNIDYENHNWDLKVSDFI